MNPATLETTRAAIAPPAPLKWHRLWQVPVFFLGATAFLAVWFWPFPQKPHADQLAHQHLQAAMKCLDDGNGPEALRFSRLAWEQGGGQGRWAGDIRYALGTAYLLSAGKTSEFDAPTAYRRARADLELAEPLSVSETLRPALLLRLAQARFHTGVEPARIVPLLQQAAEKNPRCAEEAYALLVELHLKHEPPQLHVALLITEKWLLLPVLRQPNLARLHRGELLLRLERRDEARQTLTRIPEDAAEFPHARLFHARSFIEEKAFTKAAPLWQQALQDGRPKASQNYARLMLGLCYAELGKRGEAEQVWHPLLEAQPRVPETIPAWLRLAELRLDANEPNGALIAFDEALRDFSEKQAKAYLDLKEVQERLDRACQRWRQAGNHATAKRLLEIARAVLPVGAAEERIGVTCEEAGQFHLAQVAKLTGAKAEEMTQQAQHYFRTAGEAFAKAASLQTDTKAQTELLWKAAQNLLRGQSYARAATVLETFLTRDLPANRRMEALIGLGEALQAVNQSDRAVQLLTQAVQQPHPLALRARYLLALAYIDQKKYAEAEAILRSITAAPTLVGESPEPKQSRFAMGYVLFLQQQYTEAVSTFEAVLEQFPDDPQALPARYRLAEASLYAARQQVQCFKDAKQEAARDYYSQQRKSYCERALKHFQKLAQDLSDRQEQAALSTSELSLLSSSRFGMGDCLFQLGRAQEAASVYESLALHHNHQPEGLTALMHLTQCHLHLQHIESAKQTLDRIQTLLGQLPDKDLTATQMTRQEWNEWVSWARKACEESGSN